MPIGKDDQYRVYNYGIAEGKEIGKSYFNGEDVLDIILDGFTPKTAKRLERSSLEELETAVRNFCDGIEDGIKSQLWHESSSYVKWMRANL